MGRLIRLGAVCFAEFEGSYLDFLEIAAEKQLETVELKHEPPLSQKKDSLKSDLIAQKAERLGIELAVHTRFQGLNIASLDNHEWERSVKAVANSLEFARDIGAELATVHVGELQKAQYSSENLRKSQRKSLHALRRLTAFAAEVGVRICLENSNGFTRANIKHAVAPAQLKQLRSELQNEVLFTLDMGHGLYFGNDPTCLVDELGPDLIGLSHLHDNNGQKDEHLRLGSGLLRVKRLFERYIEESWSFPLNIEVKSLPDLTASIDYADRLLSVISQE
jgi:sugar phosphate isomerase/epimerase